MRSPPITVWTVLVTVVTVVDGLHRVQEIEVLNLAAGVSVLGLLEEVPAKSVVVAKSVVTRTLNPVFWLPTTTIVRVAILPVALLDVPFAKFGLELSHVDIEAFDISSIDGKLVGVKDTDTIPSEFKIALTLTVQVVHSEPDVARKTRLLRHKILLALDLQMDVIAFAQLGLAPIAALIIFAIAVVTIVVVTSVILVVIRIVAAPIILVVRAAIIILVVRAATIILVVRAATIILVVRATLVFVVFAVAIRVFASVAAAAKFQIRLYTTFFRCIPDYRALPGFGVRALPGVGVKAIPGVDLRAFIAVKGGIEPIWCAVIAIPIVGFTAPFTFFRVWHSDNLQLCWFWFLVVPLSWCR